MSVFSLKVWFKTEFLGNHCGVLEVLQLDVLVLAGKIVAAFLLLYFSLKNVWIIQIIFDILDHIGLSL